MSLVSVWDLDTHFKVCHFSDLHAKDTGLFYVHSSGEWDDCNYLSLKISGCVYWSQRGAHGCAEKYIPKKKYRFYWREEIWHNGGREGEYGVGAQEVFPHLY